MEPETTTQKKRIRDNTVLLMAVICLVVVLAILIGYSIGYNGALKTCQTMLDTFLVVNKCVCLA